MEAKPEEPPKPEPEKPADNQVVDVVVPPKQPPEDEPEKKTIPEPPPSAADKKEPVKVAKPVIAAKPSKPVLPKQPKNGVGMAITATVIIVLGIAFLAVYAYLKTK